MVPIVVDVTEKTHVGFDTGVLSSLAGRILGDVRPDLAALPDASLSLVWVNDEEIQALNQEYRKKNEPTDVLSFSYLDGQAPPADGVIGELVISVETLHRQAQEQEHDDEVEAQVLFVHGLLHLLGFDHDQPADLKKMLAQERIYLGDNAGLIERSQDE
jgi:probable rRNA maturation factor